MSDKDDKNYLIKHGWSYTGRFPHSWRDPQSGVSDALYSLTDAVMIQGKRDHVEIPPEPLIATRIVMETITRADELFAEAGVDRLSPERMAVDRVAQMLREQIELASGRVRAGLLGTRNKSSAATTSPETPVGGEKRFICGECLVTQSYDKTCGNCGSSALRPASIPVAATADNEGEHLDCPMCGAQKSFTINPRDEAVGYCSIERQAWRIRDSKEHSQ